MPDSALDFVLGMVQRDPKTLAMAQSAPEAAGQALDLVGQGLGVAFPAQRLGMQIGQHAMEGAAALGETAMGTAFPRGFAQQPPLPRDAGFMGMPPTVSQQIAAEGAFDPVYGLGRALDWARGPIPTLGPPLPDSPEGTTGAWTLNPEANPLERLGYAIERTRGAERFNPEAFPGQKGLGELAANPLSYVGFGLPGRAAAQVQSPLLRQILGGAAEAEGLWNKVPGEVLSTAWQGAQGLPGIGGALQTSKRAVAGKGEDAMRGIISGLDTAAGQFPELQGTAPWRLLAGLKGVTKEGQVAAEAATAGLAASGLDKATLRHWGDQATQDKELGRKMVSLTQRLTPSVTEPIDLVATRTALEQRAGITAADTDALLQEALPRLSTLARKQPGWETSADVGKMIQEVQAQRLGAAGTPVETTLLRSPEYDLPLKAAQAAWLAERYGNIIPATVGRGATANEAAVLARAHRAGGATAGAGDVPAPSAAAPSAPPSPGSSAPLPVAGDDLSTLFRQVGGGIRQGMYDMLWPKVLAGETTEAGTPSALLQAAKLLRDQGRLNTQDDLRALAQQVGGAERAPGFQQEMQRIVQDFRPTAPTGSGVPPFSPETAPPFTPTGPAPAPPPTSGAGAPSVAPPAGDLAALEAQAQLYEHNVQFLTDAAQRRFGGLDDPRAASYRQWVAQHQADAGRVRLEIANLQGTGAPPIAPTGGLPEAVPTYARGEAGPVVDELGSAPGMYSRAPEPPVGELGGTTPTGGGLAPDTTAISQSVLRMTPGDPAFQAKLVQEAPDLVARYDTAKTATDDLLAQTGAKDLRALTRHEDPAIVDQAKKILNDMGGADPSVLPETEAISHAWTRDYMRSVGVQFDEPTFLQKAAGEVMQVWRQQALFAPAFFVRNGVDAATRMLLYAGKLGVEHPINPLGAKDPDSFWQIWSKSFTRAGQEVPDASHFQSAASRFREEIHGAAAPPGMLGGMVGTELQARRGLERAPLGVGRTFRTFRELYTAQEQAMREAGYWHAYEDAIPQALPNLTTQLTDALGDNGAPLLETLQATKGYMSARGFSTELKGVNVSPEAKMAAETAFGAYKRALEDAGTSFSNKLFINYKDTTNADEFLRNFLGFHVFATRSIPFYLETLATHPGLLRGVQMFQQEQKDKAKREGTTKNRRLQYAVGLPSQEDFITSLFGQAGQAMVDPTGYVSLVQAPLQAMEDNPQEARGTTLIGSVLNQLQRVGVSPAPWVQVPLQIAGAYGGQQPQNLLRLEPLAESAAQWATGQPVEAPWNALQRQRVGPMADRMPNDPAMTVRLKLREMALEQDRAYADANPTNPISPRFRQAMLAGSSDPLWREAASLSGRQQTIERGTSFVTGAPLTFRSGTAAATDAIQAGLPEVNAEGGSKPLEPVIPRPGVAPGTPLETYTFRNRRLAEIAAAGHPEASGLSQAFQRNLGEPGGSLHPGVIATQRHAVQSAWYSADPARKAAMLADPSMRPYILELKAADIGRHLTGPSLRR